MEIVPGIHQVRVPIPDNPLGYLNAYLVEGKEGWLMIDTGWFTPEAYEALKNSLKEMGLTTDNIATMVVTHVHPDHFGLAGRIKASSPKTQLIMHRYEADLIRSRYIKFQGLQPKTAVILRRNGVPEAEIIPLQSASMPTLQYVITTFPDDTVYGGETISTGIFDLEVIWTQGHSPGHICLYEPKNKILFSGDHVLPTISPNIAYTSQSGDNPLGDYICALHKVRQLPVTRVLPAHEHIFTDLPGRVDQLLEHHDKRKNQILVAVAMEPRNAYELSSQLTWDVPNMKWGQFPPMHKRSAMMETLAHLEYLRWEGSVEKITEDGHVTYRKA